MLRRVMMESFISFDFRLDSIIIYVLFWVGLSVHRCDRGLRHPGPGIIFQKMTIILDTCTRERRNGSNHDPYSAVNNRSGPADPPMRLRWAAAVPS